jgi:hypothetical protein
VLLQSVKWSSDQFHLTSALEMRVATRVIINLKIKYLFAIFLLYRYFSINMMQKNVYFITNNSYSENGSSHGSNYYNYDM